MMMTCLLRACEALRWFVPDWSAASWSPGRCAPAAALLSWPGFPLALSVLLPVPPVLFSAPARAPFPRPATASAPRSSAQRQPRHRGSHHGEMHHFLLPNDFLLTKYCLFIGFTCCSSNEMTEPLLPLRLCLWKAAISSVFILKIFCCCSFFISSSY